MRAGQECRRMDATEAINGRGRTLTGTTKIDSRASWAVAFTALAIYSVSFGAPYITVVALKPIAAELGSARSVPALAFALAWFGSALGGIAMGWLAERLGIRWTVIGGALMVALGLVLSSLGGRSEERRVGKEWRWRGWVGRVSNQLRKRYLGVHYRETH